MYTGPDECKQALIMRRSKCLPFCLPSFLSDSIFVCTLKDEPMKRSVCESETERQTESESAEMRGERERANIFLFTLDPLAESLQMEGIFHAALLHSSLYCIIFYDTPPQGCWSLKEAHDCD